MVHNWSTSSVSISAWLLRTAVDFEAALASAMLVALLLESRSGVHIYHLAHFSPMRSGSSGPWSLAHYVWLELWRSTAAFKRYGKWTLIILVLLTSTAILQFSSTILLSDLKPGPLGGYYRQAEIRSGLSYKDIFMRITRDPAWTSNPPSYPAFGEYTESAPPNTRISDTGPLLRAFLPYATAEPRQTLESYSGNSLVLDARVSCQKPVIGNFSGSDYYSVVTGTVGINDSTMPTADKLQDITESDFACGTFPGYIGSLNSSFENSTSYGTAFLVAKGINTTSEPEREERPEWLDIIFAEQTVRGASFSICFAPWDSSILNITLTSTSKRNEPLLQWWRSFNATDVVNQLLPNSACKDNRKTERPLLQMKRPRTLSGDLPPERERPLVQSDASGSSAAAYGSNTPLPGNWSIFLTGEPFITILNNFYRAPALTISADPALAAIFSDTMAASDSVAWAMSSLITVLSMTNYYSQLPAFDRLESVNVSFFSNVLYPRNSLGFILLLWALVAHYIIMATIVVLFVSRTRLTLLGNAWSAFSQLAESADVKEYVEDASSKNDSTVLRELRSKKNEGLRARLVRRGDLVEFAVEQ
ncbi:hypothetical protein DE146DRAFT_786082 [Phaeosphaeria sp. MPI-PUGE-AT-0046c]|nr:hypothetical protein DE146DRAFT_786082 [Phaeosphaeria sp. MPI-PUGE-AT-0046c]